MATSAVTSANAEADEKRLKALSEELRCLVCQNQTLADSQADLAVDLRNQVKAMIGQGQSDTQIKSYLVDRYGDFVLYKPPVQRNTWVLWLGPFVLLLLGLLIWWRMGRRSRATTGTTRTVEATPTMPIEQARKLLDD